MFASTWSVAFLMLCLFSSVNSSPVLIHTLAPSLPLQISPPSPSPTTVPSLSSSLTDPPHSSQFIRDFGVTAETPLCPLMVSPSILVVRYGDPFTAKCSVSATGFFLLGWEVPLDTPKATTDRFLVWSVKNMTDWSIKAVCFALAEQGGSCQLSLPLIVYKPPERVMISLVNHTGPMFEGHQYTLQCTVHDVAPVEKLTVTFYKGQTSLGQLQSSNTSETPVTETFSLDICPRKDDDGGQYWCEAKLELGPEGPQKPPVAVSQNLTAEVLWLPRLDCPAKLRVREGERLRCEVSGNPPPHVVWYRDGEMVDLPAHSNRKHTGKYTVCTEGIFGQINFTVEVDVLPGSGTANNFNRHFLLGALLVQMVYWL